MPAALVVVWAAAVYAAHAEYGVPIVPMAQGCCLIEVKMAGCIAAADKHLLQLGIVDVNDFL